MVGDRCHLLNNLFPLGSLFKTKRIGFSFKIDRSTYKQFKFKFEMSMAGSVFEPQPYKFAKEPNISIIFGNLLYLVTPLLYIATMI